MSESEKNSIPPRWLNCPRKSTGLIAEQFLAFKTPLGSKYNSQVPEKNRFTPQMLFDSLRSTKKELGLWIDLTNTSRFYDKEEIKRRGCKYVKIKCRGHKETPSDDQIKYFITVVKMFLDKNPEGIIGVHCTHGFNRTGFLIVAYMVDELGCSLKGALMEFANKRLPGIYKQDYINELFKRYDDIEDTIEAPQRPSWCNEEIDYDDDDDYDDEDKPSFSQSAQPQSSKKRRNRTNFKNKEFMPGVEGVTLFTETERLHEIQKKAQHFCKWDHLEFPGSQPVSMDQNNIKLLYEKPYMVSWKADGVRYMMLIDGEDEVYMLDRDNCVFKVHNLHFLHNKTNKPLKDTLLDGEMVVDIVQGVRKTRYLCYDIIRFENMNVGKEWFYPVRLKCIENEIIKPRERAIESGMINKDKESFRIGLKQFWDVTMTRHLLEEKFARTLTHEPDGLIFQPSLEPYVAGPCPSVLKWKPSDMNSIDFKLKIVKDTRLGMIPKKVGHLYVGKRNIPFGEIKINSAIKNLDGKIIECKYENNQWVFMRERTDKSFPNSVDTANAVFESIKKPVTKEYLLDYIRKYSYATRHT
ncbi:unnamed protein product [Euphydryas editha]|uniref:mRNA-capping enzyme n=1 Tax=Euphydryas editha TaxID=104508 RepID=A0AAU9V465_EUPED|nr:unnamed protein product [Euphydryas editha]